MSAELQPSAYGVRPAAVSPPRCSGTVSAAGRRHGEATPAAVQMPLPRPRLLCPSHRTPHTHPPGVKATTEGVVRAPSAFSITLACLPSMTATQEFVVPRSIPMTAPRTGPSDLPAVSSGQPEVTEVRGRRSARSPKRWPGSTEKYIRAAAGSAACRIHTIVVNRSGACQFYRHTNVECFINALIQL